MNTEEKLRELRKRWKNEPNNRFAIELQAKVLKLALEKRDPEVERIKSMLK